MQSTAAPRTAPTPRASYLHPILRRHVDANQLMSIKAGRGRDDRATTTICLFFFSASMWSKSAVGQCRFAPLTGLPKLVPPAETA